MESMEMAILRFSPVQMTTSTQVLVLVVLLMLTLEGGLPYAEAAAINTTTVTAVTAQAQDSATTTVAPTEASNIIIEDIVPKSILTILGLACVVLIGMGVAKCVDRFHDSVELRDDASDISEHTRDLLKARFALFAFTPAKLQSEADQKIRHMELAKKFGRIWMVKAAMASRKKREEIKKAIIQAANATAAFEVANEVPVPSSIAVDMATMSPTAAMMTSMTETSCTTIESAETRVTTVTSTSKPQTTSNVKIQSRPTTANTKSRPTTATSSKSRPMTAKTKTAPASVTKTTSKTSANTTNTKAKAATAAAAVHKTSTTDKPKVTLVSFKPKEDANLGKNKKADELGASASIAANKAAKRNNDFITIDIQNLDDSTETREGSSTIPSTPRTTYIDFREVSDDVTIPVRVSTDDAPRPRQPPQPKMAYAYSEFGSDLSLRQSVAKVVATQPTSGAGGTIRSRPSELEITSLSREASFESLPDYANARQGAKTSLGKASTTATEPPAASGYTQPANKRSKTPGPVSAKGDNRPVTSRPRTGHATSSRPLTAGRAQPITMGERGKSASRRGR